MRCDKPELYSQAQDNIITSYFYLGLAKKKTHLCRLIIFIDLLFAFELMSQFKSIYICIIAAYSQMLIFSNYPQFNKFNLHMLYNSFWALEQTLAALSPAFEFEWV